VRHTISAFISRPLASLETRRVFLCISSFLYDILQKRYSSLCFSSFYVFNSSSTRQHSLCIVPLQSIINAYRYSFFCQCSIYLELDTTLYIVPHQSRLLSEGSQNLPFWLTFFSVSFNFLHIDVVVCMFVVIYLASHVCCLYLREAPLYRQSLLVQSCL